jgi:hypothetical protein
VCSVISFWFANLTFRLPQSAWHSRDELPYDVGQQAQIIQQAAAFIADQEHAPPHRKQIEASR